MNVVHEIGVIKSASNESVYRPEREKEIIDRLVQLSEGRMKVSSIKPIFHESSNLLSSLKYKYDEGDATRYLNSMLYSNSKSS